MCLFVKMTLLLFRIFRFLSPWLKDNLCAMQLFSHSVSPQLSRLRFLSTENRHAPLFSAFPVCAAFPKSHHASVLWSLTPRGLWRSLTSNASWGCSKSGGFDTFIITKNNSSYLFVFSTSFWNLEAGFYRVTHVGLELDLNCCCFSLLGLKVRTPSSSISFNYLNSNQSGPSPLYSTVDALQYKVDELHRFICKRDEPDVSFRNSEPLSGDGSWGSGLICRILGSDFRGVTQGMNRTNVWQFRYFETICLMGSVSCALSTVPGP